MAVECSVISLQLNWRCLLVQCEFSIGCHNHINKWILPVNIINPIHSFSNIRVVNLVTAADAELTLYKQAPPIKLKRDDGTFNCPLIWWKYNERKYKLLCCIRYFWVHFSKCYF